MNEAKLTMRAAADRRQAAPLHYEPVIYELTGAAFAAAALLQAIAADNGMANSKSVPPGLDWLSRKLSGAAENMAALFEGRDPHWDTLDDLHQIADALEKAKAAEAHRATGWTPHV